MKKYIALLVIPLAIAAGVLYLYLQPVPALVRTLLKDNLSGSLIVENNVVEERKNGKVIWRLKVDKIEYNHSVEKAFITNINGFVYTEDGDKIEVSAPQGEIDLKTKDFTAKGGVTASCLTKNAKMYAPLIKYFELDQHAEAEGGVKVTKDDVTLTGEKVITDGGMTLITVKGNPKIRKEAGKS